MNRSELRHRVKRVLQQTAGAAANPTTSREQLLALSELSRRWGGDVPGAGELLELTPYELRVFSQNGEDGVLAEIIRRSGAPGRYFVEFGAHTGVENNCAVLADILSWGGLYIEGGADRFAMLERKYRPRPRVRTANAMVTPANVEALFAQHGVPEELDVLSIDVDGSDYWIWEAIVAYRPRIVVIEYNGELDPGAGSCSRAITPAGTRRPGTARRSPRSRHSAPRRAIEWSTPTSAATTRSSCARTSPGSTRRASRSRGARPITGCSVWGIDPTCSTGRSWISIRGSQRRARWRAYWRANPMMKRGL